MKALVIVDIQNDFLPGGALAVPAGEQVIPVANRLIDRFDLVAATQDWHPADHGSFAASHPGRHIGEIIDLKGLPQVLWPVHCVQRTSGADFAPGLDLWKVDQVFRKGTDPAVDSYSGLYDNGHRRSTGLAEFLRQRGVTDVYVLGLATDYCVKSTALDAAKEGFNVSLVEDGCRGVELQAGDIDKAIEEMKRVGVRIVRSRVINTGKGSRHEFKTNGQSQQVSQPGAQARAGVDWHCPGWRRLGWRARSARCDGAAWHVGRGGGAARSGRHQ